MKALGRLLKTTALGGFMVLLPILLLVLMLDEIADLTIGLALPVAELMLPERALDAVRMPFLLALIVLLGASFLLGAAARSARARRFGDWLEARTLARLPLYRVLRGLSTRVGELEHGALFRPVVLLSEDGGREFAYLIEEHADGRATIMLPWAPTPLAGSVKIVPQRQIARLDASLGDVTRMLSHWGVGAEDLLKSERKA